MTYTNKMLLGIFNSTRNLGHEFSLIQMLKQVLEMQSKREKFQHGVLGVTLASFIKNNYSSKST